MDRVTRLLLPVLSLIAIAVCVPRAALACFDGYRIETERWQITGSDETWDAERARLFGIWAPRIERLLPADATVTIDWGEVFVESSSFDWEGEFDDGDWDTLFDEIALASAASDARIERALAVDGRVYTVQVLAGANTERAEAVAEALNDLDIGAPGIYEAGGFPAINPFAHVVARENGSGEVVNAVIVGVFGSRDDALEVRETLRDTHGIEGFVRYL